MTARILVGDARDILPTLPARSVHCCVTSPPYFGLRSYLGNGHVDKHREIGLEGSLEAYITTLVAVFREVWRVLRDDGTCWLNMGDSYNSPTTGSSPTGIHKNGTRAPVYQAGQGALKETHLKPKDLMMVPARVALALQADGWYLRSDIIWAKRAPMPESVTDRPTSAHEHVFLLTKKPRYYFDAEAVREPHETDFYRSPGPERDNGVIAAYNGNAPRIQRTKERTGHPNGRNLRNVWTLGPEPFAAAHFATFPTKLVEPCIKAGTSERGCCPACGEPWRRVTEQRVECVPARIGGPKTQAGIYNDGDRAGGFYPDASQTIGWQPGCSCDAGDSIPCTVLDIFGGAGTTSLVADRLGRDSIYIDLNPEYAAMAKDRIYGDCPLFADVTTT